MDQVEIANMALAHIGQKPIQNFNEGSNTANTVRLMYDNSRHAVLRDYNWNFAIRREKLARLDLPGGDFQYAFQPPSGYLRIIRLWPEGEFKLQGGVLYCNLELPDVEYITDVIDETRFDSMFVEAFAWKLAALLAIPITGRLELEESCQRNYLSVYQDAADLTHTENRNLLPDNPYVDARGGW